MSLSKENIDIKRITQVSDSLISQINSLIDEGTFWEKEQGEKFLKNAENILLVAFSGETAVGFLSGYRLQRFDNKKAEVLLYEVGVEERYRKKGIATAMIEDIKQWAKEGDAKEIWVLTNKSNSAAMSLYQTVGGITESQDEQMFVIKV